MNTDAASEGAGEEYVGRHYATPPPPAYPPGAVEASQPAQGQPAEHQPPGDQPPQATPWAPRTEQLSTPHTSTMPTTSNGGSTPWATGPGPGAGSASSAWHDASVQVDPARPYLPPAGSRTPATSSGSGCLKAAFIVIALFVGLGVLVTFLITVGAFMALR